MNSRLLLLLQKTDNTLQLDDIKAIFIQVGILLGLSMLVYLYVNLRFYRTKISPKQFRSDAYAQNMISIDECIEAFRKMIDRTPTAIFLEDLRGNVKEANRAACLMHQFNREELLTMSIFDLTPSSIHEKVEKELALIKEKGELHFNSHSICSDGQSIPVEISASVVDFFGTSRMLVIVRDLSQQVAYEQKLTQALAKAKESDRLKSAFLSNMSHEIRTPMNSIMGFSELMCDSQLNDSQRREFHNIVKASSRELLNLLDDIIEFSRIEAQQIKLTTSQVSLDSIFQQISVIAKEIESQKPNIQLSFEPPMGEIPSLRITTDLHRLLQIMRILLDNAFKFTYEGEVSYGYTLRNDGNICFRVKDTGIGIRLDKIPLLFDKFYQADSGANREFGGTGIGLSIAYQLSRHLGGYMWVESLEKQGATFNVVLPTNSWKLTNERKTNILFYYPEYPRLESLITKYGNQACLMNCESEQDFTFIPLTNVPDVLIISSSRLKSGTTQQHAHFISKTKQLIIIRDEKSDTIHLPEMNEQKNMLILLPSEFNEDFLKHHLQL
jgi:PAS domain S-box-containing protein